MPKVLVQEGWLEGVKKELVTKDGHYYSFKGVPYAAPPIGKLRFKTPQPPLPWTGVKQAKEHGPVCPQFNAYTGIIDEGNEDCLYLNVYTPDLTSEKPLPVMVYIHGGGFVFGSGNDDYYGPDFLVKQGVVLVTMNYRLAAFGFLCLDNEEVPGNAGMKDQVAALRWVQNNIKQFGGDPGNVTIFGQSAGAACVGYHVLSPMSKGLFKRAIVMSGAPLTDWCESLEPKKRAFKLGKQFGMETDDPNKLLDFLQSVPAEKLIDACPCLLAYEDTLNMESGKTNHFVPVLEKDFGQEYFLNEDPSEMLKAGRMNEVDIIIGHTSEEGLMMANMAPHYLSRCDQWPEALLPRLHNAPSKKFLELAQRIKKHFFGDKAMNTKAVKEFVSYISSLYFSYQCHRFAQRLPDVRKAKRYFYMFDMQSERNFFARQANDCMYLFQANDLPLEIDTKSKEYKLIHKMCQLFTNFAKYGDPTPDESLGARWPQFDAQAQRYLDIAQTLTVRDHYHPERIAFWRSIYEDAGIEF